MFKLVLRKVMDCKNRGIRLFIVICNLELVRLIMDVFDGWLE